MPDGDPRFAGEDGGGGGPLADVGLPRGTRVRTLGGQAVRVGVTADGRVIFTDPDDPSRSVRGPVSGWFQTFDGKYFELDSSGKLLRGPMSLNVSEERAVLSGLDPAAGILGTGAAGTTGLTFGQRQQLEEEARAFSAEEAEKQRQFGLKRDLTAEAGRLTRDIVGLTEQARTLVAENLGVDVLRGSLQAQGALTIGRTPARAQEEVLRGVAAQPIPAPLGIEATVPQLQQRVGELTQRTQAGLPRPGTPLGFAGGTEGTGQGVLVGEAGPRGEARPEVIEFTPRGTIRVIPLMARAQGGLEEFDPFAGVGERDPFASTPQAIGRGLEPVFRELGFGGANLIPLAPSGPFGQTIGGAFGSFTGEGLQFQPGQTSETFGRLGVRPTLFQTEQPDIFGNQFFSLTPTGELRTIGNLAQLGEMGLSPEDAVVAPLEEIAQFGTLSGARQQGAPPAELTPFAQAPAPLRLPLSVDEQGLPDRGGPSILLPAPRQLAGMWRTLDPDTKALFGSAWQLAGVSREQAARELGFFTPRGTASQFATAALR